MIYKEINPRVHNIVLHSVQSYMDARRIPKSTSPTDNIIQENVYRQQLYSEIAEFMPTYAYHILSHTGDDDPFSKGIREALIHHIQDREFIDITLQYLNGLRDTDAPKQRAMVGSLLTDLILRYMNTIPKAEDDGKKKDKKDSKKEELSEAEQTALAIIEPARIAAANLLGGLTRTIQEACPELSDNDAIFIGGCMLMGTSLHPNTACIKNIYDANIPVTADIFNIVRDDSETFEAILSGALLLEASAFQKTGANQKAFIDSLKRWVYSTLDMVTDPVKLHTFLVRVYQSVQLDVQTKLIKLNECGPTYPYLLNVAKQLIVDKK